jgi:hypothetical protein
MIIVAAALALQFSAAPANAQFLTFVSATGNDANTCFVQANPCKTLQRGINQTSPGGELRLLSSLTSNGFINKSITIEGGRNTVIGTIVVDSASAIVRFRRLNLNGRHAFPTGFNLISAAAVHIEHCGVERYTERGILLSANVSTELAVSNSVVRDIGFFGLQIDGPTTARLVVDNSHFGNANVGLVVEGGSASVALSVFSAGLAAVRLEGGSMNVGDSTAENAVRGFVVEGGEMTLESSTAGGHADQGLFVASAAVARISNSTFTDNIIGIENDGTVLTLRNNVIAGNGTDVDGTLPAPLGGE